MSSGDGNNCTENFNEIVYNYFAENHGKVDNITDNEKELRARLHETRSELKPV